MKHYYKIKYGFKPSDFASIEAGHELERVIYAWQTGNVVQVAGKMINGNNIISITPHYHRYTGWYDHYEPNDGDDWKQIQRDCPDFEGILPYYTERVAYLTSKNREDQIGLGVELPIALPEKKEETTSEYSQPLLEKFSVKK